MSLGYSIIKLMISSSEILGSFKLLSLKADSPVLKRSLGFIGAFELFLSKNLFRASHQDTWKPQNFLFLAQGALEPV